MDLILFLVSRAFDVLLFQGRAELAVVTRNARFFETFLVPDQKTKKVLLLPLPS